MFSSSSGTQVGFEHYFYLHGCEHFVLCFPIFINFWWLLNDWNLCWCFGSLMNFLCFVTCCWVQTLFYISLFIIASFQVSKLCFPSKDIHYAYFAFCSKWFTSSSVSVLSCLVCCKILFCYSACIPHRFHEFSVNSCYLRIISCYDENMKFSTYLVN